MGKIGKFFKTITLGSLLGLVAGLLFAPQRGEETRKKLQEAMEKGKEKFQEIKGEIIKKTGCCGDDDTCCK